MRRVNNNVDVESERNRVLQFLQIATNSCHALQSNVINFNIRYKYKNVNGESLAGSVIQATGTVEHEDGLRMAAFQHIVRKIEESYRRMPKIELITNFKGHIAELM